MNAQEFEIVFYAAMSKWVSGGKVGPDPSSQWEYSCYGDEWRSPFRTRTPEFDVENSYRWKPAKKRTVTIDGIELVAPEVESPANGATYWYENYFSGVASDNWWGCGLDVVLLAKGKIFLTREDCQAMADAQRKQRLGGVA